MFIDIRRPLVFFDLETTGINTTHDRIVEIYLIKLMPDGEEIHRRDLLNPGIPIPEGASKIHGIYDEDVKDQPTFKDIATDLARFLDNCDFAGFNSNRFDFPMLVEEFLRYQIEFDTENRKFIDVQRIYHVMEPRNLAAAFRYYCNKELVDAHSAKADTEATYEILKAQLGKYEQLESNLDFLHHFSGQSNLVDLAGRIVKNEAGEACFNFGKHKGKTVQQVFSQDPSYYDWMMKGDFALQTKQVLTRLRLKQFNQR
ncbi:MAG: 3'-5' exonuclease [Bacteroidetes bacterium]|nr:MAG: 3'-5' exonuclease [Bacteroidota bacterium]